MYIFTFIYIICIYDTSITFPLTFIQEIFNPKAHGKTFWEGRDYQQKVEQSVAMNAQSEVVSGVEFFLTNISVWRRNTGGSEDGSLIPYSPYA